MTVPLLSSLPWFSFPFQKLSHISVDGIYFRLHCFYLWFFSCVLLIRRHPGETSTDFPDYQMSPFLCNNCLITTASCQETRKAFAFGKPSCATWSILRRTASPESTWAFPRLSLFCLKIKTTQPCLQLGLTSACVTRRFHVGCLNFIMRKLCSK